MNLLRLFGLFASLALTSCAALFPFEEEELNHRNSGNGYSLDNPPNGQSRYMGEPRTDAPEMQNSEAPNSDTLGADPNAAPPPQPQPLANITDPNATQPVTPKPPVPAQASYGKMVPGRVGFVYPPGVDAKPENMVDVRGFSPGEKVRDPRTGKVFLVP